MLTLFIQLKRRVSATTELVNLQLKMRKVKDDLKKYIHTHIKCNTWQYAVFIWGTLTVRKCFLIIGCLQGGQCVASDKCGVSWSPLTNHQ